MLASDKHHLNARSRIKKRLREIEAIDELTDEIRSESDGLQTELIDTETRQAAALASEGATVGVETGVEGLDAEARERLELRGRATLSGYLMAALSGRMPDGAEGRVCRCPPRAGRACPDRSVGSGSPRRRAIARLPRRPPLGPALPLRRSSRSFSRRASHRVSGLIMPSVGSGGYSEMTITTALPASPKAKGADADDAAGALTPITANPRRISARMSVTVEDVAQIGQSNFESASPAERVDGALRRVRRRRPSTATGTSSPNVDGLINQLTDPTNPTAVSDFAAYLASAAGAIDGLWASMLTEVGIVTNVDAYRLSAQVFRANSSDLSFSDYARQALGSWWTNKRMPATASTIARGIVYRMGRTGLRTACHPTMGNPISIDDI